MGKIRVKTLGIEELEEKQKKELKKRKESKSASRRTAKAPGLKGGERVVTVGPSEEELEKTATTEIQKADFGVSEPSVSSMVARKVSKQRAKPSRKRSPRYLTAKTLVEGKKYPLAEALELLKKLKTAKFDETVELHINTLEKGVSGSLILPHGGGKKLRIAVADDKLIAEIEKDKIDFDVLLATPAMMPKLAKVAKFLGPRGLMPNPKNGTITEKPQDLAKKYEGGQINFRTESKAPAIHLTVGKLSFENQKLLENIKTVLSAIQASRIRSVTLKSTMSPGIKLQLD